MNDLIGYVIVILALVCGMAGFVSARRLSVMERDRTFEQVEIYRGGGSGDGSFKERKPNPEAGSRRCSCRPGWRSRRRCSWWES